MHLSRGGHLLERQALHALTRTRLLAAGSALVTIPLGLGSRRFAAHLPSFVADYAGDALYATLLCALLRFVCPRARALWLGLGAFALSALVELSQSLHVGVLDAARATRLGRLVLGTTFVWSDFPCYAAGALLGVLIDNALHGSLHAPNGENGANVTAARAGSVAPRPPPRL